MPLPPYIHDRSSPPDRYQTVYARAARFGGRARPPACTSPRSLLASLDAGGARRAAVTLHVGLDTFRPLGGEFVDEHQIHREWYEIPAATQQRSLGRRGAAGGRVVAVGTTSVRVLETAARRTGRQPAGRDLYITPALRASRSVDALITNFHLPRSSLLLLVTAFVQAGMPGKHQPSRRATPSWRPTRGAGGGLSVLQLRRRDAHPLSAVSGEAGPAGRADRRRADRPRRPPRLRPAPRGSGPPPRPRHRSR